MSVDKVIDGTRQHAILAGNALDTLKQIPDDTIQCCVTSPPYWGLRNYGTEPQFWGGKTWCEHEWATTKPRRTRSEKDVKNPTTIQNANKGANCNLIESKTCIKCEGWLGELGGEPTPEMFVRNLTWIFDEIKRVLRPDGVVFVNLGDSYFKKEGWNKHPYLKDTDLCLVPQRFAIAMQERGWYVRDEVVWDKRNMCMPESVSSRCTRAHELVWQFSKSRHYYWNDMGVRDHVEGGEPEGANKRNVWTVKPTKFDGEHYAGYPVELPELCIKFASKVSDIILDPFSGAGTTGIAAFKNGRRYIGCELNPEYIELTENRFNGGKDSLLGLLDAL